jgi:threonine/homoserine/homoserine lactone efflux protein
LDDRPLGGIQPLSIRVPCLRRAAAGRNVIIAWCARWVLTDRTSRRAGLIFESAVFFGQLVVFSQMLYATRGLIGVDTSSPEYHYLFYSHLPAVLVLAAVAFCLQALAMVTGAITAVRPVNAIFYTRDHDIRAELRRAQPHDVFNSLFMMQMLSVGVPVAIYVFVTLLAAILVAVNLAPSDPSSEAYQRLWDAATFAVIYQAALIFFLSLGGIFAGIRYENPWSSFWLYLVIVAVCVLILLAILIAVRLVAFAQSDPASFRQIREDVILFGVLIAICILFLLAKNEVQSKLQKIQM